MPKYETTRSVAHGPMKMFDLVADVEKYPQFLPLCKALTVRSRKERDGDTILVADMTVGYKAILETFTSQVYLKPDEQVIEVKYLDGPFRYLEDRWLFVDKENGCEIDFFIDFEFRSRLLQNVMEPLFHEAVRRMVRAFEKRASERFA